MSEAAAPAAPQAPQSPAPAAPAADAGFPSLSEAIASTRAEASGEPAPAAKPRVQKPVKSEADPKKPTDPAQDKAKSKKPWDTQVEDVAQEESGETQGDPQGNEEGNPDASQDPVIEAPANLKPEAKARWGELRKTEEAHKKIMPEYEKLKKEVEELRKAPAKLPPEMEQELNELRQHQAAYAVKETPEFKKSVVEPLRAVENEMKEAAAYAKVDYDALMDAADIPNKYARGRAIKDVLSKSTEEIDDTLVAQVIAEAEKLHPIYQKAQELEKNALEIRNALTGKEKVQTEAQQREQEQKFTQAAEEMHTIFKTTFAATDLFKDAEMEKAVASARQADVKEDPMMAAYQAKAAVVLPALITQLNAVRKELAEKNRILAARAKTGANLGTRSSPAGSTEEEPQEDLGSIIRSLQRG